MTRLSQPNSRLRDKRPRRPAPTPEKGGGAFVGRRAELALLSERLRRASCGQLEVVLVQGSAGIGKTTLLRQFAMSHRLQFLWADGDEIEAGLPFGVVQQLVRQAAIALPSPLDALDPLDRPPPDVLAVGAAIVKLLSQLQDGGGGPAGLVVDNLHWADKSSLQALTFALRRARLHRILVLLTAREDIPRYLPESLRRMIVGDTGTIVALGGLEVDDIRTLGEIAGIGELSTKMGRRLQDHTAGNPLHVRDLFRELPAEALYGAEVPLPAPRSFSATVLDRLQGSSPEVERLAAAAAVLGATCPWASAAWLADIRDPLHTLERAVQAGVLQEHVIRGRRVISFPHPLARAAVYHHLGPARKATLHDRAARLVDDDAARLRHRVAAAKGAEPELAAELATYARHQAAQGAWAAAADTLTSAVQVSAGRDARELLQLEAIECLLLGGDVVDARAMAEELMSFADSARLRYVLGSLELVSGRHAQARAQLIAAWRSCDRGSEPLLAARIAGLLTTCFLFRSRGGQAVRWARRALTLAPEDSVGTNALDLLLVAHGISGQADEALALAAPMNGGRPGDEGLDGAVGGGILRLWTDDLPRARAELSEAADAYQRNGWSPFGLVALSALSEAEFRMGAWDDAVVDGELAASTARDTGQTWLAPFLHSVASYPLAGRGDWNLAETHVHAAQAAARVSGGPAMIAYAALGEAYLARARGAHRRVVAALAPVADRAGWDGIDEPGVVPWRDLYVDALIALGQYDAAEAALAPLEARAAQRGRRSSLLAAARARGLLEAARGRHCQAEAAFRAGLGYAEDLAMPFERARLEVAYGAFLRRSGRRRAAAAQLRLAQQRLLELDARPDLARCRHELAACGLAPTKRRARDMARLTPQELAVARLVGSGLTNRQTAAELMVSVKTVEFHLGNVYTKLGVSSRSQLVLRLKQS